MVQVSTHSPSKLVRRLEPTDIHNFWHPFREVAKTLYTPSREITDDDLKHLLLKLVTGSIQMWISGEPDNAEVVALSGIERDPLFGKKYLHLLGVLALRPQGLGAYFSLKDALLAFSRKNGCEFGIIRTDDPQVEKLLQRVGAKQMPIYYMET